MPAISMTLEETDCSEPESLESSRQNKGTAWGLKAGYIAAGLDQMRRFVALPLLSYQNCPLLYKNLSSETLVKVMHCTAHTNRFLKLASSSRHQWAVAATCLDGTLENLSLGCSALRKLTSFQALNRPTIWRLSKKRNQFIDGLIDYMIYLNE